MNAAWGEVARASPSKNSTNGTLPPMTPTARAPATGRRTAGRRQAGRRCAPPGRRRRPAPGRRPRSCRRVDRGIAEGLHAGGVEEDREPADRGGGERQQDAGASGRVHGVLPRWHVGAGRAGYCGGGPDGGRPPRPPRRSPGPGRTRSGRPPSRPGATASSRVSSDTVAVRRRRADQGRRARAELARPAPPHPGTSGVPPLAGGRPRGGGDGIQHGGDRARHRGRDGGRQRRAGLEGRGLDPDDGHARRAAGRSARASSTAAARPKAWVPPRPVRAQAASAAGRARRRSRSGAACPVGCRTTRRRRPRPGRGRPTAR